MAEVRRTPKQQRSRERVERIVAAAAEVISESGVDGLSIVAVAKRTGISAATIYRYFTDRDELAAAYLDREMEKLDAAVAQAFLELDRVSLRTLFRMSLLAHLRHHQEHPEAVPAWFGSPRSAVVDERVKLMDLRTAEWLQHAVEANAMIRADAPDYRPDIFTRLTDRILEYILTSDMTKDEQIDAAERMVDMVASYVERFATDNGLHGVPTKDFLEALGETPVHLQM